MNIKMDEVTAEFVKRHARDCSIRTFHPWQLLFYPLLALTCFFLLSWRWDIFLFGITFYFAFWYLSSAIFRAAAVLISLSGLGINKISQKDLDDLKDEDLPVYTILAPLYKEANIADRIVKNLENLDYPKDKLDVKLLLEEDDQDTLIALENTDLPAYFQEIVVPDRQPKTKPRACNFGLIEAKGELCVIYDAEDRPDPDQLKKAVLTFQKSKPQLACVQAKLNYYNPTQNLLTRWFTIEYSTTFDLMLPGLELLNVPIPLGGTSNHFRTDILREIGGWDPFNVTEDCDLGVRIYKKGYKTCLIDSTTWEEANSDLWNWIRQRSRWIKGYFQTHLTHMRNPFRTVRQLGLWGFFGFYLLIGTSSFMALINIFYWFAGACYLSLLAHAAANGQGVLDMINGPHSIESRYQGIEIFGFQLKAWPLIYSGSMENPFWTKLSAIFFAISCVLLLANLLFVLCHVVACLKRGYYRLLPHAFLTPFYWVLISIAAWKGFLQLFTKPFYWEKTVHGLNKKP